jgi:T4 RnlA family RNA ligase
VKIFNYIEFIKENSSSVNKIPTYNEAVEMCSGDEAPFYESKYEVEGYPVSVFNYRLAQYKDFDMPVPSKPELKGFEMRGLTFVFNKDGTLYNRYVLLEKFFNLNQVPTSMYSVVKNYKIKFISNKEDGSIASFIELPNGKIVGRSKMGFDNDQATGINKIYKTNKDVKSFVDWCLNNDIVPIFEYVAPHNRIVLRYSKEELILLRLRDNKTGKHIDIKEHLDKIGSIKIAPFEDDDTLDDLIEKSKTEAEREGWIVQFDNDHMVKIKTDWYRNLHSVYTNDLYHEDKLIKLIIDEKIDDILGQIPEDEVEAHLRINKIILIVKRTLRQKVDEINSAYKEYLQSGLSKKEYAIKNRTNPTFPFVMNLEKAENLKKMSREEILDIYDDIESYERSLKRCEPFDMAKEWLRDKTKRLEIAREWLKSKDSTLFFQEPEESEDDN